jgi:lambda repressor-like predicted transcriptional regulator
MAEHGTYARYADRCRCAPCRKASSAYTTNRKRQIAYGRWEPYVDAGPVREHLGRLRKAGIGWMRAAQLAGLAPSTVEKLLYGAPHRGLGPSKLVRRATAEKLLAVNASLEHLGGKAVVDATGTRRRLQALVAIGWSQSKLGRELDMSPQNFSAMFKRDRVHADTARAVRVLYDRLWNAAPPETEHREKIAAARSRSYAAARGWARPMAWDDDTIDDPNAVSEGTETEQPTKQRLPERDDLQMLLETGSTVAALAQRFDVKESSVKTTLRRCGLKAAP